MGISAGDGSILEGYWRRKRFTILNWTGVGLLLALFVLGVICEEEKNTLSIVPPSRNRVYQRALGKSSIFTCTANVEVPEKLTDFKWYWPDGKVIEATDSRDVLNVCGKLPYVVKVTKLAWRCLVVFLLKSEDHYVMDKDGIIIRSVSELDEGVYTCRVRVTSMGTVEERHIQVEVHELPQLTSEPEVVEGVETESVTLHCAAKGKPQPEYEWVKNKHQDLRVLERHTVDKYKGTLQIDGIRREDAGTYTCTAKNRAGYVTMKSTLNVVIEEFKNITTQVNGNAILTYRASGDPAPDIKFHKDSNRDEFLVGQQHDSRIFIEQRKDGRETIATLKIQDVLRTDDGLYNCIAFNQRTKTERLGHITVEFPPVFNLKNFPPQFWSWDNHKVNVSCMAEAIPNATISWFIEGAPERPVDPNGENIRQIGFQSLSSLEIRPIDRNLYSFYKCVATNKLGTAEHRVQLKEARKRGPILEAIVIDKTATTVSYKIVGPVDDGGLPVKSFVAQYKEDRTSWEDHKLKSWPVDQQVFIIEDLEPMRTYYVRFAAESEVGRGNWALEKPESTPRRSAPEPPTIMNEVNGATAINAYPDRFELIWKVPADNGERLQGFEISYTPVAPRIPESQNRGSQVDHEWDPVGQKLKEERAFGEPRHMLRNLKPGTFYKVEIRARNIIGKSAPGTIIIKIAAIPGDSYNLIKGETTGSDNLPLMIVILVAGVFVVLFLVDISCYRINQTGIIWTLTNSCNKKKSRESLVKSNPNDGNIQEKRPLTDGSSEDPSKQYEEIGPKTNGNGTNGNSITPIHITHTHHRPSPKDSEV